MKFMGRALLVLLLVFIACGQARPKSHALPKDGVAYSTHGTLVIKDAFGKTVRVIKTKPSIGSFAISPDRKSVVFAPSGTYCEGGELGTNGGPLYLLSLASGHVRRLIPSHKHVFSTWEVYADPDFSPDGTHVAFAVHATSCGDAVMASGPVAVLDLRNGIFKALPSTVNPDGQGTAYVTSPRWSPGGDQLALNLEDVLVLTDPSGTSLQDVYTWTSPPEAASVVGWLGNHCLAYMGGNDWNVAVSRPASVLDLRTHRSKRLDKVMGVDPGRVTHLVAFSPTIQVRKSGNKLIVETQHGTWNIVDPEDYPNVRVFSTWTDSQLPPGCR